MSFRGSAALWVSGSFHLDHQRQVFPTFVLIYVFRNFLLSLCHRHTYTCRFQYTCIWCQTCIITMHCLKIISTDNQSSIVIVTGKIYFIFRALTFYLPFFFLFSLFSSRGYILLLYFTTVIIYL